MLVVGFPARLVSHFLSFVSHFFSFVSHFLSFVSHFFSFVSQFFSFVSQTVLVVGLSIRLGAGWSGRVPGLLVSHFLSFVSQFFSFVSQAQCLWSGSRLACLPLPFICLPLLLICLPVLFICPRSGSRLACLPLPFICLPLLFTCLPVLFICLPGWVLAVGFPAVLFPASFHLSPLLPSSGLLCPPNPLHVSPCVYMCLPALDCCGRLCLAILCLPALDVAGSSCRVFHSKDTNCLGSTMV